MAVLGNSLLGFAARFVSTTPTSFAKRCMVCPPLPGKCGFQACLQSFDGRLRPGSPRDTVTLASLIAREGMNPLLGDPRTFLVYETADGVVVGCGNVRGDELASLVVAPSFRGQGIGSKIIQELVELNRWRDLFLLCLDDRIPFYERFGFRVCNDDEIPTGMQIERWLGNIVVKLVEPGRICIAMKRPSNR